MYLFRAINPYDYEAIMNTADIESKTQCINATGFLSKAAPHISSGSNASYQSCWISATKSFRVCASEFSIPQLGGYCTANKEKPIIVIDTEAWRKSIVNQSSNGNCTAFFDGNDNNLVFLGDSILYPQTKKAYEKGKKYASYYFGNKKLSKRLMQQQVDDFLDSIKNGAYYGLLDLSFPTSSDRKFAKVSGLAPINEFSLMDYQQFSNKNGGQLLGKCQGQPIASGSAKGSKEVLFLNRIKHSWIKKLLSRLETTVLYSLTDDIFESVLNNIITGILNIRMNGNCIYVNDNPIKITADESNVISNLIVDLVCQNPKPNTKIEDNYNALKEEKRSVLAKVLKEIRPNKVINDVRLQDDSIIVKSISSGKHIELSAGEDKYDLLAVQILDENRIIKYSDENGKQQLLEFVKNN